MVPLGTVLGLRWGEAAGLRVGDIDFLSRTVSVLTQRTRGEGRSTINAEPKWGSARTLTAPEGLFELIGAELSRRGVTAMDGERTICVGDDGRPLDYTNWRQRAWVPACVAAELPGLRFQSLRTANTTAMVALAVDIKTAQIRAGHKNAQTTLNIYARPTLAADKQAAEALGTYFLSAMTDASEPTGTQAASDAGCKRARPSREAEPRQQDCP